MKLAVLCDLDGTLAEIGDRSPYDADQCGLDTVNQAVVTVLRWARAAGNAVVLVSGRGLRPSHRAATERWLTWNEIEYDELLMRRPGDNRPDTVIKAELYRDRIQDTYHVIFVLDDRRQVVEMWRREFGLTVFQVDERLE